jgi:glycosyltransferase involved in cell wall biosynthesis
MQRKCHVIPYGVSLNSFPSKITTLKNDRPIGIFVGLWSYQKGCDLLYEATKMLNSFNLVHVGAIGDLQFSGTSNLKHINKVDQNSLFKYYQSADFFVLPSRQDGFGMVLSQALATGLPVLTTFDTGGFDLQLTPALKDRIMLIESNDLQALVVGIEKMLNRLKNGPEFMELSESDRLELSWKGYGERYHSFIQKFN